MIQSAFHRTGDHSRRESCPSLRFASARRPGLPVCCARSRRRRRSSDFCQRYDREHDPSKGWFLASPAWPRRRTVSPAATNRCRPHPTYVAWENDGEFPVAPVLVCRPLLAELPTGARERAVPVTSPPPLRAACLVGTGREPRVEDSSVKEVIPHSTQSRASLGHRCVRGSLDSAPARRTSRRHARRFAPREGSERCERIEMLSIVHHPFARVRIAPRHARVEPGRPSPP